MYPLHAILVGCTTELQAQVRRLLALQGVRVEGEFPSVSMAIDRLRGRREPCLFLFYADAAPELPELRRLRGAFVGQPILAILTLRRDFEALCRTWQVGPGRAPAKRVLRPLMLELFLRLYGGEAAPGDNAEETPRG